MKVVILFLNQPSFGFGADYFFSDYFCVSLESSVAGLCLQDV